MLVVGLTGGIGSGKTTVSRLFAELGIPVIDADVIARQLLEPGSPLLVQIRQTFGEDVFQDSQLDRARLRDLIFAHPEQRQRLDSMMHPQVRSEIKRQLSELHAAYCVVVVPLLLEKGWEEDVNRILVVDTEPELQVRRASKRDGAPLEQIHAIMGVQVSREVRLAAADDVIVNNGSLDELRKQVSSLHEKYLALSVGADS